MQSTRRTWEEGQVLSTTIAAKTEESVTGADSDLGLRIWLARPRAHRLGSCSMLPDIDPDA